MTRTLLATAAVAALAALPADAARAGDWGGIFSAIILTSDYRFNGVSSSDNHPALQGYAHWQNKDGLYAGVFASQVDFNDFGTSYEIDTYAGRHFDLDGGRTRITPSVMYSSFPDNETPGPTYDFLQAKLTVQRIEGKLTVRGHAAYTPQASYGAGQAWLLQTEGVYAVTDKLRLETSFGRQWIDHRPDRTFWRMGASYTWKTLTFDLHYEDTDLDRRECGFNPDVCGPSLVGRLTVALPPIL